jgi:hypothetical protein
MSTTPKTDAFVRSMRRRGVEVLRPWAWGTAHPGLYVNRVRTHPHSLLPGKPVDTLWNHITVTFDDGRLIRDFGLDLREVERIGWQRFGTGVSYNILVDANAPHPRIAIGQCLEARGAHTLNDKGVTGYSYNQNKVSLAIAWVGMPGDRLNAHAVEAMIRARVALMATGSLTRHYDDNPHSLVAAKDCPTGELRRRLPALKREALSRVK